MMKKAADWILLSTAILASIPFVFANLVVLVYKRRKYFQAQGGVDLILIGSVAGLIWIASSFVVNSHIRHRDGILRHCELWSFWLRNTCGISLWLVCIILRLHRMHLLSKGRNGLSWKHCLLIPVFLLPTIFMSIAATVFGAYKAGGDCHMKDQWRIAVFVVAVPTYFSVMLVFMFMLRGKRDPMLNREYLHTCEYSVMALLIYLLTAATYFTRNYRHVEGRCYLTFCVCCLVFFHFWVRMGWPVYLCLFRPEREMDEFEDSLRERGASIFRSLSRVHSLPDAQSSEGAILQAFADATEEVELYKKKVNDLEIQKQELLHRRHLLEGLLGAADRCSPVKWQLGTVN